MYKQKYKSCDVLILAAAARHQRRVPPDPRPPLAGRGTMDIEQR